MLQIVVILDLIIYGFEIFLFEFVYYRLRKSSHSLAGWAYNISVNADTDWVDLELTPAIAGDWYR